MARKRKYPKVKGWWVYSIQIKSNGKYYIGVSKRKECWQRWNKCYYKDTALEPYLDEWDSMEKTVLVDNLTKEQAYQYEDNILRALKMNNLCINKHRSGLIASDENAYNRELLKNNAEYHENHKQRCKQWRENNPDYMKQWQKDNKEKVNEKQRQRYLKKKLEKQQTSLQQ